MPEWPTRGAGGADAWQEATRTDPRGRPSGAPRGRGFAYGGPTGKVGPGKYLGAVTQMRYRAPIFKHAINLYFFRVGLCSHTFSILQVTWLQRTRQIRSAPIARHRSHGLESTRSVI